VNYLLGVEFLWLLEGRSGNRCLGHSKQDLVGKATQSEERDHALGVEEEFERAEE
jgi:hypothetical protein